MSDFQESAMSASEERPLLEEKLEEFLTCEDLPATYGEEVAAELMKTMSVMMELTDDEKDEEESPCGEEAEEVPHEEAEAEDVPHSDEPSDGETLSSSAEGSVRADEEDAADGEYKEEEEAESTDSEEVSLAPDSQTVDVDAEGHPLLPPNEWNTWASGVVYGVRRVIYNMLFGVGPSVVDAENVEAVERVKQHATLVFSEAQITESDFGTPEYESAVRTARTV